MNSSDLQFFASTDPNQPSLHYPWSDETNTFASDGGILIRIPRLANVPINTMAPTKAGSLINQTSLETGHWCPIPTTPSQDMEPCLACNGTGKCTCPCCTDKHLCKQCQGSGQMLASTFIGNLRFLVKHIRLLRSLPECQWCLTERETVYFKFGHGDGIVRSQTN